MIKTIQKLKNKKAFTLVEVIIVLVILAILAAVMIPSLTGYIDKADERALISEARQWLVAAQTALSETYGSNLKAYETAFSNGREILNGKPKSNYSSYISTRFNITEIDEDGKEVVKKVHAGRISNSYLSDAQKGKKDLVYPQGYIAAEVLKYMDSGYGVNNPTYKFNSGEGINSKSYLTADKYFSAAKNKNQDVAVSFYFDENAKVVMLQFAKRGYSKIVELYPSGYKLVDKVNES